MASTIKIVHTADNHIGMKFQTRYAPDVSDVLVQERFSALERIVEKANEQQAHFLVIAGDLFDTINIPQRDIKKVTEILAAFAAEVIVIPGNHDFFEEGNDKLWSYFKKFSSTNTHLLSDYSPATFEVGEQKVVFYPCGCRSKHSATNVINWIEDEEKDKTAINIGIAHGNVEGLGLGGDRYFNMTPAELKNSGLDCWLLGHIHAPYPAAVQSGNPGFFFSATHTPDGFNNQREGFCWSLEFDSKKQLKLEQWTSGNIRFYDWSRELNSSTDIEKLSKELYKLNAKSNLLRLRLHGRLSADDKETLTMLLSDMKNLLHFEYYDEVLLQINQQQIDSLYTQESLPHMLLTALAGEEENELAVQLAHQLLEEVKK